MLLLSSHCSSGMAQGMSSSSSWLMLPCGSTGSTSSSLSHNGGYGMGHVVVIIVMLHYRQRGGKATEQAIHLRTMLLILAWEYRWSNAHHYPLKGCRQGKEIVKGKGRVYLAWGTCHTGLQGKDQENLTEVLWWQLWPLYTTTMFVHVYTRSPIKYKRDYCYWSRKA